MTKRTVIMISGLLILILGASTLQLVLLTGQ